MSKSPWFKFYASDYLLDKKVDSLPLEAQAILIRMWAIIWNDGSISSDPAEIARKCCILQTAVQKHLQNLLQMFRKDVDGNLYSERMDRERERSERISFVRSQAVQHRHNKSLTTNVVTKHVTNEPTNGHTKTADHSQKSDSDINTKPFCLESPSEIPKQEPEILLILNDSTDYPIYPEQVSEWRKLYPAVNVPQELRSMRGWCISNPAKRKTKTGILRFVNSWLAKAQDRGGSGAILLETEDRPTLSVSEKLRARAAGVTQ